MKSWENKPSNLMTLKDAKSQTLGPNFLVFKEIQRK